MKNYDVVIIGAGAAGLMCALTAGQRGRNVMILDHADHVGKKILISGGGSCNFTNLYLEAEHYISHNPHFCKSALNRFCQYDFISLVKKHNVSYQQRQLGQLFCNGNSVEILNLLLHECRLSGVKIQKSCTINNIEKNNSFSVKTNSENYTTQSLVIATGGLSMPTIGATGFGYDVAKKFGLNVQPGQPGLVPLTFNNNDLKSFGDLSGISLDAAVSSNGQLFREAILFTHRGLSGPAVLQISNYWQPGDEVAINLLPDIDLTETIKQWQKERPRMELKNLIGELLTRRIAKRWLELWYHNKPVNQYNEKEINQIADLFHVWRFRPAGTEGYKVAEVTRGGVDTEELSSKTFEARRVKGLYFIGEVVDVTGWLGGYNLQWAWSSGYCAGQFV
ncbi:flavoprotein [Candidatus Scalindua japonica]|uniref:Flavoprotein n=1 Tax=Candidatus Scalindua japonica TaxID=1284222 RepID=A0A286TYP5_9BACT|nr:NAD(P)/FAD-dependent oxidoreductase [Candidatus Scalindua japonica]GAX60978.1 flavoprotein [Candidatus Scalindua japonica]